MQTEEIAGGRERAVIAVESAITAGGLLMVLGSFSPWTQGSFVGGPVTTFYRTGFQLGPKQGFSLAGLLVVEFGALALLNGAVRLAGRHPYPVVNLPPIIDGLVGVAIGLYAVGEAAWYTRQLSQPAHPGGFALFNGAAAFGVWLVLVGGLLVFEAAWWSYAERRSNRERLVGATVVVVLVSVGAFLLAPK